MHFKDLKIIPPILEALNDMGYSEPTDIQQKAIPDILEKKDVIAISKTGSGKTAVYGISMLQLMNDQTQNPQALIITPTRELAVQVDSNVKQMAKYLNHKTAVVYGQHSISTEIRELKAGISIVTGTPGRLYDHIEKGTLVTKDIHFLVLDEADRMLDMGFIDQVEKIIRKIPKDRVTLLFSATMPDEIQKICRKYLKDPVTVEVASETKTVDVINQYYIRVEHDEKRKQLERILVSEHPESCIIFCNTRMTTDRVQTFLEKRGLPAKALHGDVPQGRRSTIIRQFKSGSFPFLVATDVAARGLHIDSLELVVNYDMPLENDSYVHRIGRTGRAGKDGKAINLITGDDIMTLYEIEEHIGAVIREEELPSEEQYRKNRSLYKIQSVKPKEAEPKKTSKYKPGTKKPPMSSERNPYKKERRSEPAKLQDKKMTENKTERREYQQRNSRKNQYQKDPGNNRATPDQRRSAVSATENKVAKDPAVKPSVAAATVQPKTEKKGLLNKILGIFKK